MLRPQQEINDPISRRSPVVRYTFALLVSVAAVGLKFALDRFTNETMAPFLPGFAAIIACAAWASPGAGTFCTLLLSAFSAVYLRSVHISWVNVAIRCGTFGAEGLMLNIGTARMLRSVREAALSASWHRRIVETAGEGIWVRDNDDVITYANARLAEILRVPLNELIGRKTTEFYFPADLGKERIHTATLSTGVKEQFDRRLRRSDGAEIWVLACCNFMPDEKGATSGFIAMMTDITERKRAEHALRRSEERFRNLFESVLEGVYQSTPEGRFLAANPMLLKMLGFSSESEMNDVRIARDLYVDPSVRRRLLDRLEAEGSFQNVEYELRTRDGGPITVLGNARVVRDEHGGVLYYEGTLIDISERKRIDERLREAQKVEALGLLAKGIAHDFNSVLAVIKSQAQRTLSLLDPVHPAHASAEQALQAAESAMGLTGQLLLFSQRPAENGGQTGETILLVDGEPLIRELSRDMLERQGYQVLMAADASEAERVGGTAESCDLLITRVSMPDMSGTELVRRLRAIHHGLKVLFIAGYMDEPLEREDLSGPAADFLRKPFSADSLGRKIRQLLAISPVSRTRGAGTSRASRSASQPPNRYV